MMPSLPFSEFIITGCVYIQESLSSYLNSPAGLALTRESISHFESFFEMGRLSTLRLISPEMLSALTIQGPNSTKIHSTLRHQCPSFYEELMTVIQAIKGEKDEQSSAAGSQSLNNSTTNVTIKLGADDELSVKVLKRQKLGVGETFKTTFATTAAPATAAPATAEPATGAQSSNATAAAATASV
eukprot:3841107-Amphidinium_carterae.1